MGYKKIAINKIQKNKTYKMHELAKVLKVCVATIWNWVKDGMPVINRDSKPWYFDGSIVKKWLEDRRKAQHIKMQKHEIFCVRCRKPVEVIPNSIKLFSMGYLDKNNFIRSIKIEAKCKICGRTVYRFSTDDKLYDFLDYYMIKDIEVIESKNYSASRSKGISNPKKRDSN